MQDDGALAVPMAMKDIPWTVRIGGIRIAFDASVTSVGYFIPVFECGRPLSQDANGAIAPPLKIPFMKCEENG